MLHKSLILRLFRAFTIQRWNDQIRPVPLVEMDKNAHKMAIAYCLARSAEDAGQIVHWHNLIRGGIFELLRRSVLSDIKSPIYWKVKVQQPDVFKRLSLWVYEQLEPEVANQTLLKELKAYLVDHNQLDEKSLEFLILRASHLYSSHWEFQIIRQASPETEATRRIENAMLLDLAPYTELHGLKGLLDREPPAGFLDMVGQLRFQIRWAQTPRLPLTSVLGHSMMVAALAYLLTRELPETACDRRIRNNFFGGLLHDLPEAVTRDIISPVKGAVPQMKEIIKEIERELMAKEILPLIKPEWGEEVRYFTGTPATANEQWDEFDCRVKKGGNVLKVSPKQIANTYNKDRFEPIDGNLIEVADHLSSFVEARKSIEAGVSTPDLQDGMHDLNKRYEKKKVAGLNIGSIYADFK
jgi:putative hydrolases of HD superfamily